MCDYQELSHECFMNGKKGQDIDLQVDTMTELATGFGVRRN